MRRCNFVDHQGPCTSRALRADHAMQLCAQAGQTVRALEATARRSADQLDLFEPVPDAELIAFWWGVHAACGREYRRLSGLFWGRCKHRAGEVAGG